jgi:UV DNA damage repair endonuclease
MARFADLMWTWKKCLTQWTAHLSPEAQEFQIEQHEAMLARMPMAQVIVADNVSEYRVNPS